MTTVFELPQLYGEAQTGKVKIYKVSVVDNQDGSFSVLREHGQLGGKTQIDEKRITEGKNVGKANETTPQEQAIAEAKSYWKKKLDSNYSESQEQSASKANLLPMLAQSYKDSGHRIAFPCYGQAKLNGVRCLAKRTGDTISFTSRKGKSYDGTLGHLIPTLLGMMQDGEVFDGEIYIHGKSFQTIVSYVKKLTPESKQLQYWVYDIADSNVPFEQRYKRYKQAIVENPFIIPVESVEITSAEQVKPIHDKQVQEGFEGLIIRNKAGLYSFDYRSADLQKYKEFIDEEFLIVGGRTADTGRYQGCCVFQCATKEGKVFECCPRGSVEVRKQYLLDLPNLLNKQLTVRYQNLSDDGIPIFPVGVIVRDYEI